MIVVDRKENEQTTLGEPTLTVTSIHYLIPYITINKPLTHSLVFHKSDTSLVAFISLALCFPSDDFEQIKLKTRVLCIFMFIF